LVHSGDSVAAGSYIAYFSEQYNNQPANGETITIAATGDCSIVSSTSLTVGNNIAANAYAVGIEIASVAATAGADTVSVSNANPGSQTETQPYLRALRSSKVLKASAACSRRFFRSL